MENCLKTQLKGIIDNDNLKTLGNITFFVKTQENPNANSQRIIISSNGQTTVQIKGGGYINSVYENLETEKLTSITFNTGNNINFFVSNHNGKLLMTKNNLKSLGKFEAFDKVLSFDEFGYCEKLEIISFKNAGMTGELSILKSCTALKTVNLENNNISGHLESLGELISLEEISLNGNNIDGSVDAFVEAQYLNGRTVSSSSPIRVYHILKYATFNGKNYNETYTWLTWENSSKIAIYAGESSIGNCTTVYCKGYGTQEQAEAALMTGSVTTVIRVDA